MYNNLIGVWRWEKQNYQQLRCWMCGYGSFFIFFKSLYFQSSHRDFQNCWSTTLNSKALLGMRASQVAPVIKNPPATTRDIMRYGFDPWVRKSPWRRAW